MNRAAEPSTSAAPADQLPNLKSLNLTDSEGFLKDRPDLVFEGKISEQDPNTSRHIITTWSGTGEEKGKGTYK